MKALILLGLLTGFAAPLAAQTYSGTLEPGDATRDFGELYDAYSFEAKNGQQVTVRMEGDPNLDSYLIVRSPSGTEWNNDDFEGSNISQVSIIASEPGTWNVWASAYNSEQRGPYTLVITPGGIAEVTTVSGRLDPSDRQTIKGEYYDTLPIDAPARGTFAVELVSYGFDGFLRVSAPSGQQWRNDDAGSTTLSRVENLVGASGNWTVDVTTVGPGQVGAYDLRVIVFPEK
ncbi:MAG: PPC domain-containing protein [Rhodothermales bacterium]